MAVALFTWEGVVNPYVPARAFDATGEKLVSFALFSSAADDLDAKVRAGIAEKFELETPPGTILYLPVSMKQNRVFRDLAFAVDPPAESFVDSNKKRENQIVLASKQAQALHNAATKMRRTSALKTAAMLGSIPAVGVLLLGLGLGWAIAGFRRS